MFDIFLNYYLDTDSLTIATTMTANVSEMEQMEARGEKLDLRAHMENVFLPIVKKDRLDEFKRVWGNWLVLSNTIEEKKKPGKLKPEWSSTNGQMICLAPKSYFAACRTKTGKAAVKDGRKGIPKYVKLTLDDFAETLYGESAQKRVEVHSLRLNKDKEMTRTTTRRVGLTGVHVKMSVGPDKISCSPLQQNGQYI